MKQSAKQATIFPKCRHSMMMRIEEHDWFALDEYRRKHKLRSKGKAVKSLLLFYEQNHKKEGS